jgi:hypothetical protein
VKRILFVLLLLPAAALAQTREEWIRLGEQVHGGFGTLIALGIRVGQDAQQRLSAGRRELEVVYLDGPSTPCPCVADGILIATSSSPGQNTLRVASDKAAPGLLAEVRFRHRKSGKDAVYRIPMSVMPRMGEWNKTLDPRGRYDAVMGAEASSLFTVQ